MTEGSKLIEVMEARAARREDRRAFFKMAAAAAAAPLILTLNGRPLHAQSAPSDADILNFALNLEYLEAQFYYFAFFGTGLPANILTGSGAQGGVRGGRKVNFTDTKVARYAAEIAADERAHVEFLRGALIFEDVGVTAYKGAAPLINSKTFLEASAGILAVEAYHAGLIRTTLFQKGIQAPALITATERISDARDSLDDPTDKDQGIAPRENASNIAPLDANGIAYSRSAADVLNIVYLTAAAASQGGFFPNGVNGAIRTSSAN
jgi:hypothetical protein